ncbi:hypothetical protein DXG01_010792 [Tephrocybe rancida]|nr:hypothetical protein DXG01_010792 [Tephrocybe rancida]
MPRYIAKDVCRCTTYSASGGPPRVELLLAFWCGIPTYHTQTHLDLSGLGAASFDAAEATSAAADPTLTPRAWWKVNPNKTVSYGLGESLEVIRDILKTRRFDVSTRHVVPNQFCVAASGFRLRDPFCDALFDDQYATPTLHIIGKTDIIVTEERSKTLVEASSNARVEYHDGGHFVPSKRPWLKFLHAYMLEPSADLPSPSAAGSSVPNSGMATPTESDLTDGSTVLMKL